MTAEQGTTARGTTAPDTAEPGAAGPVRHRTWATGLGTGRRGVLLPAAGWAAAAPGSTAPG